MLCIRVFLFDDRHSGTGDDCNMTSSVVSLICSMMVMIRISREMSIRMVVMRMAMMLFGIIDCEKALTYLLLVPLLGGSRVLR